MRGLLIDCFISSVLSVRPMITKESRGFRVLVFIDDELKEFH